MKADAVLIDGIIVDDDAVQKSRAHFILVVPTILYGDLQRGCRVEKKMAATLLPVLAER